MSSLTAMSWNMRSFGCATPYIQTLMNVTDILMLSEHRMYANELYKLKVINKDFDYYCKSSHDLTDKDVTSRPGHGGIAMCWKKSLNHRIHPIESNSDRIIIVELSQFHKELSLFIIGVYLPHQACQISSFENHIKLLEKYVNRFQDKGLVLILGDTNCHFGPEVGERCWGTSTPNAHKLLHMMYRHNLICMDVMSIATGPTHTFHVNGVGSSYIDHCIISQDCSYLVQQCGVINDAIKNTSDHLPVYITLLDEGGNDVATTNPKYSIAWRKLKEETIYSKYTEPLQNAIQDVIPELLQTDHIIPDPTDIDKHLKTLTSLMTTTADNLTKAKNHKCQKRYWNPHLTGLAKKTKSLWKQWVASDRPRLDNNLFLAYKSAKKEFRSERHKAEIRYEQVKIQELCNSQDMDQGFFWHIVNKGRKQHGSRVHPLKINNKVVSNPDNIRDLWREYYKDLYTPKNIPDYDNAFMKEVNEELSNMMNESYKLHPKDIFKPYTIDEVNDMLNKMKFRKAPGFDCVQVEHIRYGGVPCLHALTTLYNSITFHEYVPPHFKFGIILPIPKGDKDKHIQDNNRGITLLPSIAKLYENVYVKRLRSWVRENNLIDDLQGASQEKCSSLQTNWLEREAISHFRERGSTVYVALLDVAKAFDSIWHNGLFYVMNKMGFKGKFWRMVIKSFEDFQCCVSIGGIHSDAFVTNVGLHQGAPLSMLAYCLLDEMLLKPLTASRYSIYVGNLCVTSPAYADDLTINAISARALQHLLDIVFEFSCKWRLQFNPTKCKIIVYGEDKTPHVKFKLGDNEIQRTTSHTHVGTMLSSKPLDTANYIKSRIKVCKKLTSAIHAIGSRRAPVTPKSACKVYNSICLSKLLYGFEIMDIPSTLIKDMESFHAEAAKSLQGLPVNACNHGALRTIGWINIQSHIDIKRLLFLWRIICLPVQCIYKKLLITRYSYINIDEYPCKGPLKCLLDTANKYQLLEYVHKAIECADYMSIAAWKKLVNETVVCRQEKLWNINVYLYSSLKRVSKVIPPVSISAWWLFCQNNPCAISKCKTAIRLLLECHNLNVCACKYPTSVVKSSLCTCCSKFTNDTIEHLLFECDVLSDTREILWNDILSESPSITFTKQLEDMDLCKRATYLVSGLNNSYVSEWDSLFSSIVSFIHNMYKQKLCHIDN